MGRVRVFSITKYLGKHEIIPGKDKAQSDRGYRARHAEWSGKEASYTVQGNEGYIRAEALREDGARAWTQPFWINV